MRETQNNATDRGRGIEATDWIERTGMKRLPCLSFIDFIPFNINCMHSTCRNRTTPMATGTCWAYDHVPLDSVRFGVSAIVLTPANTD